MKKVLIIVLLSSLSSLFGMKDITQDSLQKTSNNECTYCTDIFGNVAPSVCGTVGGGMGLTYKACQCCLSHDYGKSSECCYKLGCDYSWFPSCSQTVECNGGGTCQPAPAQWISSIGIIVGCSIFLPWTIEKLCGDKIYCNKKN